MHDLHPARIATVAGNSLPVQPLDFVTNRIAGPILRIEEHGHGIVAAHAKRNMVVQFLEQFVVAFMRAQVIHYGGAFCTGVTLEIYL